MSGYWFYRASTDDDGDPPTIMRSRIDPEVQVEITNTILGHWKRVDDYAHVMLGVDAEGWVQISEDEARSIPGIDWFDDDSTETVEPGAYEIPAYDE